MPKTAPIPQCSEEDRRALESWAKSRTLEARLVERARIILRCLEGRAARGIAQELKVRPNTVIDWRRRFEAEGIAGLLDPGTPGQAAPIYRGVPQSGSGYAGVGAPARPSDVGRSGGGEASAGLGACGVAGVAQRGHLSDAPAQLVREHRPGVCRQGRRSGGAVR